MARQNLSAVPELPLPGQTPAKKPVSAFESGQEAAIQEAIRQHAAAKTQLERAYSGDRAALDKAIENMQKQQRADTAEEDKAFSDMQAEESRFSYNLAKINAPQQPTMIYRAKEFQKFLPIAVAFAALGTAATHGDIAVGMQALADGLNGYRQGNENEYNRKFQEWKDKMQTALEANHERLQLFQNWIAKSRRDGAQHLQANLEILKAGLQNIHDDISLQYIQNGSLSDIVNAHNKQIQAHQKFQAQVEKTEKIGKPPTPNQLAEYIPAIQNQMKYLGFDQKYDMSTPAYHNVQDKIANYAYFERVVDPQMSPAQAALNGVDYATKRGWWTEYKVPAE